MPGFLHDSTRRRSITSGQDKISRQNGQTLLSLASRDVQAAGEG